jgi:hypothetical protein
LARELKGTVKEVLGTCLAVGITVDGKNPKEVTKDVEMFDDDVERMVERCLSSAQWQIGMSP